MTIGKHLMDEITELAQHDPAIARSLAALTERDREALGEILADTMVDSQIGFRARERDLLSKMAAITGKADPIADAYEQDQTFRKGATPMVASEKTHLSPILSRDELYPVPQDGSFGEGIEFLDAPDVKRIAADLIERHRHIFGWLADYVVLYRWRKVGGETAGKAKLGECKKANGHDRFLYGKKVHFFVTLSADNIRDRQLTREQVEALIFHELNHAGTSEKGKPMILPHEFEGFKSELTEYGPWSADLQRAEDGFQARMDLRADDAEDEE